MTRFKKTISAALTAIVVATGAMTGPASANGSLSISINPTNQQENHAIRTGLALYSLYNRVSSGGSITQRGNNNAAGVGQNGRGNTGIVHQEGSGHNGTIQQNGNRNAYGLFQFGRGTSGHVVQNGNGRSGATFQFGW